MDTIIQYQVPHKHEPSQELKDLAKNIGYPQEPDSLVDIQVFLIKYFDLAVLPHVTLHKDFTVEIIPLSVGAPIYFAQDCKTCSTPQGYYEVLETGLIEACNIITQKMLKEKRRCISGQNIE